MIFTQPSLLQAQQLQLPQPVFVKELLQSSYQLCGSPLDLHQQFHILLILGALELCSAFQVRPHKSRVEGQNHLLCSAGHAAFDAAQYSVGLKSYNSEILQQLKLFNSEKVSAHTVWDSFDHIDISRGDYI